MADISSITLPGGGTYDLKDKNSANAITSLNKRYTDKTLWISNSDANDYKTSGMYAMATRNANLPVSWGILFVIAPRHDTIEQEYRYLGNIWNREFRNNTWSAWTLAVKQSQLAYVETGTTASRNYTAGQYISLNGLLYTADTAIASGATFYTSGGNKNLTECVGGVGNSLSLKHAGTVTGTQSVALPATWTEVICAIYGVRDFTVSAINVGRTLNVRFEAETATGWVTVSSTSCNLGSFVRNGQDQSSQCTVTVYYR